MERWPREHYERLFTAAGAGSLNMTDYFAEMSLGKVDLSGSKVFGWFTLPIDRADYKVPPEAGKLGRPELVDLCFKTLDQEGVDVSSFPKKVISLNADETEFYGYFGLAVCDSTSLWPALLGHEMGHGYGLDHSRKEGSQEDYEDRWDVMSFKRTVFVPHPEYEFMGPGLDAANMRALGWLDESRVWQPPATIAYHETIRLRPLHRPQLDGYLAAQFGPYLAEFRLKDRWDKGFDHSCVMVHRFDGGHSYVMPGTTGAYDLGEGGAFTSPAPSASSRPLYVMEVLEIDEAAQTATISVEHRILVPQLIVEILAGIAPDGGGLIFWHGKILKIPPSPPVELLVNRLLSYLAVIGAGEVGLHSAAARTALRGLAQDALAQLAALDPPPPSDERQELPEGPHRPDAGDY